MNQVEVGNLGMGQTIYRQYTDYTDYRQNPTSAILLKCLQALVLPINIYLALSITTSIFYCSPRKHAHTERQNEVISIGNMCVKFGDKCSRHKFDQL